MSSIDIKDIWSTAIETILKSTGNLDQEGAENYQNQQISLTADIFYYVNKTIALICHNQQIIKTGSDIVWKRLIKFYLDFDHCVIQETFSTK